MSAGQWLQLFILGAIWGGSYFFMKVAVAEMGPFSIVLARCLLGALVLCAALLISGLKFPTAPRDLWDITVMALLNALIPFSLICWAEQYISSGLAAVFNATTPVFAALCLHFITHDQRLTPARITGVVAGLGGVAVLIGPDALQGLGDNLLAQLAALAAAALYAISAIYSRRLKHIEPLSIASSQVIATTLLSLPLVLLFDKPWLRPLPGPASLWSILALGVLSTALAYIMYFKLLATAGAANTTLVTFLIPISATVLGVLVLHEQLFARHYAGMALIGVGLVAIDGRFGRWLAQNFNRRAFRWN
ncbi:DMT family transporter [bacterium]|nr:DMT family transporter [bacterium]